MTRSHLLSGGRYPVLRSLAILYLVGAGLAVVGGLIMAGWALFGVKQEATDRLILLAGVLAGTFFVCLTMLAIAEVLKLMIDIEQNTRLRGSVTSPAERPGEMTVEQPAVGRMAQWLDGEETAEGALVRGH